MTLAGVVAPSKCDLSLARLDMEEEVDIEKGIGNHIMKRQQDPLFATDSTPTLSFVSESSSENKPSKSRPKLSKKEFSRRLSEDLDMSQHLNAELSRKVSTDILEDHNMKRSSADILKRSSFDKKKYAKVWLWAFGALALMVIFGVGGWAFPDGSNPTCDPSDADKNKTVCGMIEVIQSGTSNMAFLSGFIIASFVSSAVKFWRMKRTNYCGE